MASITTERTSSLSQSGSGNLAVRLSSARPHMSPSQASHESQLSTSSTTSSSVNRVPRKPAMPRHPIPAMQEAFAESLAEVTSGSLALKPQLAVDSVQARRDKLIDQDKSEGPPAALWRYRPGQNCHELRKLLAQISFGVYLLLKGMANSNAQVVAILQGHIDEVDEFLRTAMDDIRLAIQDLSARLEHLRLPLNNLAAFEEMLEDRNFRLRIVEGNVRIEHIISRTTTFLVQIMQDSKEGLGACREFSTYLASEEQGSWHSDPDVADIYEAMRGNGDGWLNAFLDLEEKSNTLDVLISKLADMVTEMDRCAGEVSRRTRFSIEPFSSPEQDSQVSRLSHMTEASIVSSTVSSHETTPPASPRPNVAKSPPRLSLRLSTMDAGLSTNFLDLNPRNSFFSSGSLFTSMSGISETEEKSKIEKIEKIERIEKMDKIDKIDNVEKMQQTTVMEQPVSPPCESDLEKLAVVEISHDIQITVPRRSSLRRAKVDNVVEILPPSSPDSPQKLEQRDSLMPIPLRINMNPLAPQLESPAEEEHDNIANITEIQVHVTSEEDVEEEEGSEVKVEEKEAEEEEEEKEEELFILQPRTYTPLPTAPLPSPMVRDTERTSYFRSSTTSGYTQEASPIPQVLRPAQSPSSRRSLSPAVQGQARAVEMRPVSTRMHEGEQWTSPETSHSTASHPVNMASPRQSESWNQAQAAAAAEAKKPHKRPSLRDRISLRTTPPDAIHVPVANAPALQRPVFASPRTYQNYRTFTGPESSNSAETERATHRSVSEAHTPSAPSSAVGGFTAPVMRGVVPSPRSDLQYFRPVQASPHSPLQQRPHTASQVPSRPHHLRNVPSSMGMSTLSSVTTMTHETDTSRTLKKKRSAFGWLKKAFTLDEEERAEFDQRKNQAQQSNYYADPRGPKFLDGRRIR